MYQFRLEAITGYGGRIPDAVAMTLVLTAIALVCSTIAGFFLALARVGRGTAGPLLARAYIELFRNIPLLVLLYVFYFGLAQAGFRLSNFWASVLALTTNATAYAAEIFRGGFVAVPAGQREAARSLGLRAWQIEWTVVLPQVVRIILPAYTNQIIGVLIGSSIAAVIGVGDLADWMLTTGSDSFRYMEAFLIAALIYVGLCQAAALAMAGLDRHLRVPVR